MDSFIFHSNILGAVSIFVKAYQIFKLCETGKLWYIIKRKCETKEEYSMKFICYPRCTTCQKARKWLEEQGMEFEVRHIAEDNPTAEELTAWLSASGLPVKKFFNTSGLKYKELHLKDKLPAMTDEEKIALLATDGMLVKRPLLSAGDRVLVGCKQAEWEALV